MKIQRTFDRELVNSIIRHPDIFPTIKDDHIQSEDDIDLGGVLSNSQNVALLVTGDKGYTLGVFIFISSSRSTFEAHTNLLSSCRGENALQSSRLAIDFMFTSTPCARIVTRVPEYNKLAYQFAVKNGFSVDFCRESAVLHESKMISQTYFSLSIYDWSRLDHVIDKYCSIGQLFHDNLESLKTKSGIGGDIHDEDAPHDFAVGRSINMMLSGQTEKSEYYYNEWAQLADYAQARHLGIDATGKHIVDISEVVISIDRNLTIGVA